MSPAPYGLPHERPFGACPPGTLARVDPCPKCGRAFGPDATTWHHRSHVEACTGPRRPVGRPTGLPVETIERIERDYAGGLGLRAIARALNEERVPTADRGTWHASTVRAILLRARRPASAALSDLPD